MRGDAAQHCWFVCSAGETHCETRQQRSIDNLVEQRRVGVVRSGEENFRPNGVQRLVNDWSLAMSLEVLSASSAARAFKFSDA